MKGCKTIYLKTYESGDTLTSFLFLFFGGLIQISIGVTEGFSSLRSLLFGVFYISLTIGSLFFPFVLKRYSDIGISEKGIKLSSGKFISWNTISNIRFGKKRFRNYLSFEAREHYLFNLKEADARFAKGLIGKFKGSEHLRESSLYIEKIEKESYERFLKEANEVPQRKPNLTSKRFIIYGLIYFIFLFGLGYEVFLPKFVRTIQGNEFYGYVWPETADIRNFVRNRPTYIKLKSSFKAFGVEWGSGTQFDFKIDSYGEGHDLVVYPSGKFRMLDKDWPINSFVRIKNNQIGVHLRQDFINEGFSIKKGETVYFKLLNNEIHKDKGML